MVSRVVQCFKLLSELVQVGRRFFVDGNRASNLFAKNFGFSLPQVQTVLAGLQSCAVSGFLGEEGKQPVPGECLLLTS